MSLERTWLREPRNPGPTPATSLCIFYASVFVLSLIGPVQAKIGYFWHITDIHLDYFYSPKGEPLRSCWHSEHHSTSSNRAPGRFGDYLCDSPWSLLESATLAMKSRQGDNVEFVLWTGDGLSHSAHRLLESTRLDILRNITELLGRTFPSQFVFPVLGHEDGSISDFRLLGELWRHWLPSEAVQTFEKGGYYTIEQTKSRLRIIALNTNFMRHDPKYSHSQLAAVRQRPNSMGIGGTSGLDLPEYKHFYYHHGEGHHYQGDSNSYGRVPIPHHNNNGGGGQVSALSGYNNQDTEKQWRWFEEVLEKSKLNKETVYIVGHIPPGSDERLFGSQQNGHTTFSEKNNLRYLRLVRKYSSIIQGQFFGHLHSDSFRIIYNDLAGKPVSWIMISPSVTPRKLSVGSNNPAMRLYKFDTDTGQVLDYTQYYLDLGLANAGEANWQPEYNLTHYYGLAEVSSVSLHNLADRFTNTENVPFGKYYRANSVRYPTQPCEGVCALNHYCAITRVDYVEFRQCLESAASALASRSPTLLTYSPSIILLFVPLFLALSAFKSNALIVPIAGIAVSLRLASRTISRQIFDLLRRTSLPHLQDRLVFSLATKTSPNRVNTPIKLVSSSSPVCNRANRSESSFELGAIAPVFEASRTQATFREEMQTASLLSSHTNIDKLMQPRTKAEHNTTVYTIRNLICQTVNLVSFNFISSEVSNSILLSIIFISVIVIVTCTINPIVGALRCAPEVSC
ncbi:acid sphingomyelinase-like phosphodiesterase 3b isoform X3 [Hermetia illucens]|nr:acid sphingomyelinase-like phosphodiesterase 3b isoform X3 [Hermetia illucens]